MGIISESGGPVTLAVTKAWNDPDKVRDQVTSLANAIIDKDAFPGKILMFPDNLYDEFNNAFVRFTAKLDTYSKIKQKKNTNLSNTDKNGALKSDAEIVASKERDGGSVYLPMPQNFLTSTAMNYEDIDIGKVGADSLRGESLKDLYNSVQGIVSENVNALKQTGISALLSSIATKNEVKDIVGLKLGKVRNPHMQVLFRSVPFRGFDFVYILRPRDREEAATIINIIKFFSYYMSPSFDSGETGYFFRVPNQFSIEVIKNEKENPTIKKIGRCVLEAFNCNYTPDGIFNAYDDGMPIAVQIDLRFKEIEIITKEKVNQGY